MKRESVHCPRCGGEFQCCPDKSWHCGCGEVALSREELDYIGSLYDSCLCNDCLRALRDAHRALARGSVVPEDV